MLIRKRPIAIQAGPAYIPNEYWLERGVNYMAKFEESSKFRLQERILVDLLRTTPFTNVLELGCGFGRISKILISNFPKIEKYIGVDLSPHQIENAKRYTIAADSAADIDFIVSEIQKFRTTEKFDLVLASEVLLHILPVEIRPVIEHMVSMSSRHVINIDWYVNNPPERIASHNFLHQYEDIYKSIPSVSEVSKIPIRRIGLDTKQCIFHAMINNPRI